MTTTTQNNEKDVPAVPLQIDLRDWFAGQLIGGVIMATKNDTRENGETHEQMFARRAYALADALLSARKANETR